MNINKVIHATRKIWKISFLLGQSFHWRTILLFIIFIFLYIHKCPWFLRTSFWKYSTVHPNNILNTKLWQNDNCLSVYPYLSAQFVSISRLSLSLFLVSVYLYFSSLFISISQLSLSLFRVSVYLYFSRPIVYLYFSSLFISISRLCSSLFFGSVYLYIFISHLSLSLFLVSVCLHFSSQFVSISRLSLSTFPVSVCLHFSCLSLKPSPHPPRQVRPPTI